MYGKYMIADAPQDLVTKMLDFTDSGRGYCGAKVGKRPGARMSACAHQFRLWGIFPTVQGPDDVTVHTFHPPQDHAMPCNIDESPRARHAYVHNVYRKERAHKKDVLLVVVTSKQLTPRQTRYALENIFTDRGVIGYAFGYFSFPNTFEVVRVFLNYPYRGTPFSSVSLSSMVLDCLRKEVEKKVQKPGTMRVDAEAPCFHDFGEREVRMYTGAGFSVVGLPENRRGDKRRTAVYAFAAAQSAESNNRPSNGRQLRPR